ncbi:MAG: ABC transporter substrate-binding protein [Prevotella sp.]|nr:ABC transporter substrate-binding protein [Prevotella sp.]
MKKIIFVFLSIIVMAGCKQVNKQAANAGGNTQDTTTVNLQYSKGLIVKNQPWGALVEINDPQKEKGKAEAVYKFQFVRKGETEVEPIEGYTRIEVPVKGVVCMTSLQLAGFIKLGALDFVAGINSSRHLFDIELKARIKDGRIVKIGKEGNFDEELVIAANPTAILVSLSKRGGFDKLEEVKIPLIPYMGYQETTPLAQAEWIKFVGLLTGKTAEANRLFAEIEKDYAETKALVSADANRPEVLYGKMHGDNWYAMGGESFIAQIIKDAGAHYFMEGDERTGGVNLDFETVYAQAEKGDFWVIQNKGKESQTYGNMKDENSRYADFRAWKEHKVLCCDISETPVNELSSMEPDFVLKDFIKAFHPDLLKDYTPKYYKVIK